MKDKLSFSRPGMLFGRKEIILLIIPLVCEQILSMMVGLADSVMVSSAGETAVSAVSLVDSIIVLVLNIFFALASGGAVIVGQYLGRREEQNARKAAKQLMVVLFGISLTVSVLLLVFSRQILHGLYGHAEETVLKNCATYYGIVMFSVPFIAIYNGGASIFRIIGDSRTPMKISLMMNAINVTGNAILIYGFKMGVAGVAIPSLVSRGIAMAVILYLAMKKNFRLSLRGREDYGYDRAMVRRIFSVGIPNGIENGMFQFGKLMLVSLVSTLPTAAITANAIGNTTSALHCVIGIASNAAVTTVVSRCAGAGEYKQARFYINYIVRMIIVAEFIWCSMFILSDDFICRLYNLSAETAALTCRVMNLHASFAVVVWPLSFMLNNAMRAAGDARFSMIVATVSMWLCRVGLGYVLVLFTDAGVMGIWYAWMCDWVFRIFFFVPRYLGHKWETKAIK